MALSLTMRCERRWDTFRRHADGIPVRGRRGRNPGGTREPARAQRRPRPPRRRPTVGHSRKMERSADSGTVRLALAGDTMLGRKVAEAIARLGPESLFADEVVALTRSADLFVLNLECCISRRGSRWPDPAQAVLLPGTAGGDRGPGPAPRRPRDSGGQPRPRL